MAPEITSLSQPQGLAMESRQELRIARTIQEATAELGYEKPLNPGDPRYVDLREARGDQARNNLLLLFQRKPWGDHRKILFASHRGVGKSTEILWLQGQLTSRYLPIYLEAQVEMNAAKIEMEDLLLVLARRVMQTMQEYGRPLPSALLRLVENWFAEKIQSTDVGRSFVGESRAEAGGGWDFGLIKLLSNISAILKVESEHRQTMRLVLREYPATLLAHVNDILDAANALLVQEGRELLLLVDNLDRYGPQVVEPLLFENSDRIQGLRATLLLTPDIFVVYRPGGIPWDSLPYTLELMCSVRMRNRHDPYNVIAEPARSALATTLARRIDLDSLIPDRAAQDRLILASGGSIRDLLRLAAAASLKTESVILYEHVELAVKRHRAQLRDRINANRGWLEALVAFAKTKKIGPDDACMAVLSSGLALKYNDDYWYDIHPLVAEIPEVQAELNKSHDRFRP